MTSRISFIFIYLISFIFANASFAFWPFRDDVKRDYIYITGSSTISPLIATVSEEFSRVHNSNDKIKVKTPVVESVGTGEGIKLFCSGMSLKYPDFVNASRTMNDFEQRRCANNGVNNIAKITIGYDGIVIGNYVTNHEVALTKKQIFLALAAEVYDSSVNKLIKNPYEKWSDIDPKLPNKQILVFGPPKTSGTRDIFKELVMADICLHDRDLVNSYSSKYDLVEKCPKIRVDGKFVESGENDNLIVQRVKENPDSFGIFGFNFLVVNPNIIRPVRVDNNLPTKETIATKKYSLSRPLFVYFKKEAIKNIAFTSEFIKEIISTETIGKNGYLIHGGLVPLSDVEMKKVRKQISPIL